MLARKSLAAFLAPRCPPSCSCSPSLLSQPWSERKKGASFQNKRSNDGKGGQGETPSDSSQMENSGHPASDPLSILTGLIVRNFLHNYQITFYLILKYSPNVISVIKGKGLGAGCRNCYCDRLCINGPSTFWTHTPTRQNSIRVHPSNILIHLLFCKMMFILKHTPKE